MTIYGLSTGQGRSGIAIIRVSGKEAGNVIKSLTGMKLPVPKLATLRKINYINTSELIDEGIILWFPGPHSYTGEDMAEFQVHGSQSVIKAIHRSISEVENCRLAEPGEFTKLAFLNGKINLLKAESIGDLISSETEIQRKQAIKIMEGRTSKVFNEIRKKLLKILSHIEAKIDFPDEDLPNDILEKIKKTSKEITNTITKILDDGKIGERIREGFKIAIVGPPNSGKSSLMNNLSKREVAIVSEFAGTTRDVIETHLNIDGYPIIISDTAGIRKSENEIEQKGIKLAFKNSEAADLRLVVIEPKTLDFTGFLKDLFDENSILVINKSDLGYVKLSRQIEQMNHVVISVLENKNINELISKIKNKLKNKFISNEETLITRERHRENLLKCLENLKNFNEKYDVNDFDKAAEDLRLATRSLGKIVGNVDVEDILDSIFNDFCIGK